MRSRRCANSWDDCDIIAAAHRQQSIYLLWRIWAPTGISIAGTGYLQSLFRQRASVSTIIAGRFQTQDEGTKAVSQLVDAGFPIESTSTFFVNPAGQHDQYAVGGDRDISPGAEDAHTGAETGATTGGIAGLAVGLATLPILGPAAVIAGAGVGALTGSVSGTMSQLSSPDEAGGEKRANEVVRNSGVLAAVAINAAEERQKAIDVLKTLNAEQIEEAEGTIENQDWVDFDSTKPVRPV
jgi:hypothetical protein